MDQNDLIKAINLSSGNTTKDKNLSIRILLFEKILLMSPPFSSPNKSASAF